MKNTIFIEDRIIVIRAEKYIINKIKAKFTFKDLSKAMNNFGFDASKIKKVCFLKKTNDFYWLYSGMLHSLLKLIKKNNWKFVLDKDNRTKINIRKNIIFDNLIPNIKLREYQIAAIKKIIKNKVGIIKIVTSGGKTLIAAAILKIIGLPFLFLVNKKSLADQVWNEFNKFGLECGICYSNKRIFKESMVSTIGSVYRIKTFDKIKILIVDECHRASSNTYQKFFKNFIPPVRIGLSATPEGNNQYNFALVRQFLGSIEYTATAKDLMQNNFIAEPIILFVDNFVDKEIDWIASENNQIINNEKRNKLISDFVNKNDDKCILILVTKKLHGKNLNKLIPNSIYLDGSNSVKERNVVKDNMESGKQKIVITTSIFNEGISINSIQILLNVSARKSAIETVQKIGRSLRIKDNKKKSLVIDFKDNGNYILMNQSRKRWSIWEKEGFDKIKTITEEELINLNVKNILM